MDNVLARIAATIVCTTLFWILSQKPLGAMQQSGYKSGVFLRWLEKKDNMLYNRLTVLSLCLVLASSVTALCFSFLAAKWAQLISAVPFLALLIFACVADGKYALKVSVKHTGRFRRLSLVYFFVTACVSYILIAFLAFLEAWNASKLYDVIAYIPFGIMTMLLPFLLCFANGLAGIYDNTRNKKFVKRAGQVLDEKKIVRVGVVGSYGKTSVKNILKTLLSEKYAVVETPQSYNTPIGIAKTVFSSEFENAQVFIAEMGARKSGDIAELCALVKPDCAIFTGVCEQHIDTFETLDNVFAEKSEIIKSGAFTVCGETLKDRVQESEKVIFAGGEQASDIKLLPTSTEFVLTLGEEKIAVKTSLLSKVAVENITLAATLAYAYFHLTAEEISNGIAKLQQIPHRLELRESNGVYILDDAYNCNPRGAEEALAALALFEGRKCVITPGIVECGVLEEELNGRLGEMIAKIGADKVILIGDTLVGAVKTGYQNVGGDMQKLSQKKTLEAGIEELRAWLSAGDCVLFLNDLPDVY